MSDFQRRDDFIPYNVPDITDAEINEVVETLKSGWVAKGPRTNRFEQEFAGYLGAKHAVAMNSCTAALHIALLAKGIGPGDEVITTPMTFASTASTIIHTGATPVFADIDYRTGCIDPDEIEKKITSRTKAIVPVHYSGQVCDLDRIYAIADKHGLFVSEDAAHALWSRYKGRLIGNKLQGAASYSFYATKNLCTGDGGMLVTDDDEIDARARILSGQGMSHNAWNRYAKGGSWKYDIAEPGFKYNMFDIQAALGLVQLSRLEEMQAARLKDCRQISGGVREDRRIGPAVCPGLYHPLLAPLCAPHCTGVADHRPRPIHRGTQRAQRRHKRAFYPGTQHVGLSEAFRLCGQRLPDGAEAFRTDHLPPALSHDDGRAGGLCYRSCNGHCRNLSQINLRS